MTPSARQIDAKNSVPCRAAPNAIAAAPHQANTSAAAHRWRLGDNSHIGSADRRQIASTACAGGPPARSSGDAQERRRPR